MHSYGRIGPSLISVSDLKTTGVRTMFFPKYKRKAAKVNRFCTLNSLFLQRDKIVQYFQNLFKTFAK